MTDEYLINPANTPIDDKPSLVVKSSICSAEKNYGSIKDILRSQRKLCIKNEKNYKKASVYCSHVDTLLSFIIIVLSWLGTLLTPFLGTYKIISTIILGVVSLLSTIMKFLSYGTLSQTYSDIALKHKKIQQCIDISEAYINLSNGNNYDVAGLVEEINKNLSDLDTTNVALPWYIFKEI